jgi:pimeloyl-ACP methyl ester carboxylesterase
VIAAALVMVGVVKVADLGLTAAERRAHPAPGMLVDVGGRRMHVLVAGSGGPTIVLLPGLGTPSPVYDFEPLTEELSTWATVAVVEPFGYGWSDTTNTSMRPAEVASDLRAALAGAGVAGPYVLMGHSLGGLYVQAFADHYPGDTSAVVGIDPTMPRVVDDISRTTDVDPFADPIPWYLEALAWGGWVRVIQPFAPDLVLGDAAAAGYSAENLAAQRMIANWTVLRGNMVTQARSLKVAIEDVRSLRFRPNTPVLVFTADPTGGPPAQGADVVAAYSQDSACTRGVRLVAGHYLHHTESERLSKETRDFLADCGR